MTDLGILVVVGNGVLAAGLVGVIGEFLVRRLSDRRLATRVAREFSGPSVEGPETGDSGVAPAAIPALAFAGAGAPSFADREMAYATSTTT